MDGVWQWRIGGMMLRGKNTRRKNCPSATLSTTNPTWNDDKPNQGFGNDSPGTNSTSLSFIGRPQFTPKSLQIKQISALRRSYGSCRARCYKHEINTVIGRNRANQNIFPPSGGVSSVINKYWTFRSRHHHILTECKRQLHSIQRVTDWLYKTPFRFSTVPT